MQFDKRDLKAWNSGPETVPGYMGGSKVSEESARRTETEPHDRLMIAHSMGNYPEVKALVKKHGQEPKFLEVANAVLGDTKVKKILNG